MTLEICVDSLGLAVAAVRGGADRIELCGPLDDGGVTPDRELVVAVRQAVTVPIAMLVRQHTGPFTVSEGEFEAMRGEILFARHSGMDIVVLGILHSDRTVDVERMRELVELARPMEVTFHRAFDVSLDMDVALRAVLQTGATRLLTSGGSASGVEGAATVGRLQQAVRGELSLVACGRITSSDVAEVLELAGVREVHAALRQVAMQAITGDGPDAFEAFVEEVSALKQAMDRWTHLRAADSAR